MNSWEKTPVNEPAETPVPWEDAIVAEVRAARLALLAAADFDLDRLGTRLRAEQAVSGHEVVTLPSSKPVDNTGEAA